MNGMPSQPATPFVLTLLGPDRPGLVESLSQVLADHGGNWVESRMARLAGQFAGILRADLPTSRAAEFREACGGLATMGLQVIMATGGEGDQPAKRELKLELVGQDRPGIVREISTALARSGVNVEELTTGVESAPMSAEKLFYAKARLAVPVGMSAAELTRILEPIGNELMVDVAVLAG
jgi:glycine cleavage system regulatory protein